MHREEHSSSVIRVVFSEQLSTETLQLLHHSDLAPAACRDVKALLEAAHVGDIRAVYELSADEIRADSYGFAREFKLHLLADADLAEALQVLRDSSLVTTAGPLAFREKS